LHQAKFAKDEFNGKIAKNHRKRIPMPKLKHYKEGEFIKGCFAGFERSYYIM